MVREKRNPRLWLTVQRLPRPSDWPFVLGYGLEDRGGLSFLGGPLVVIGTDDVRVGGSHRLPEELLPKLSEVDLESEESILAFVRSAGVLGAWREDFRIMDRSAAQLGRSGTGRPLPFAPAPLKTRTGIDINDLILIREKHARGDQDEQGEFVDEFRVGAGGLLGLLEILRELEARPFSASDLARRWPRYCPWEPPEREDEAWEDLVNSINVGIESMSLGLGWVRHGEVVTDEDDGFLPGPPVVPVVSTPDTLYGVCALELADHVLAGEPYRRCANETCGRLFTVQEGRSRYGGHRTDNLKYHTPACKDAQAAREYRRRKAVERRK
jgi:hypothetical protein